jgi:catechol 2,3-dioxygenase-like lactoylglutathione lyase family enzyme
MGSGIGKDQMRVLLTMLLCGAAFAQTGTQAPAEKPAVIGILNFPHAVQDLDTTVAFYREVFALDFNRPPAAFPNPGVPSLVNAPGISLRLAMIKMPGAKFQLELTNFSGVERKPAQPMPADPGAADLQLRVRDLDAVFAKIKKSGAPIITRSGAPVTIAPGVRSVLVRDPDGYIVEVIQAPLAPDAPAGMVQGVAMGMAVENLEATEKFYHELMGFDLTGKTEFQANEAIRDLVDAPQGAQFRQMVSHIPGTEDRVEFYEYKNVPHKKFHLRVYDPGAPALVLRVNDLEGMLKRMREAGTEVLSARGEIVQFTPTTRNIFVVDPNGVNLELYETKQ